MSRRLLVIGLLALVVAGGMTFIAYREMASRALHGMQPMTRTVVAAKDLVIGSMIAAGDLKMVDYPQASLPQGANSDPAKVVGRGVITSLAENEPILESKLAAPNAGAGLPAMIPPNMRAVSVQVNDVISVAGFVGPGTHVDVLLTGTPGSGDNGAGSMTTTVLENAEVLAAGQKIQPDAQGKPEKVPVVTLLVSPDDAQRLTLASVEGKIQLALRNPLDTGKAVPLAVRNATLYRMPAPATPAPMPVRVTTARVAQPKIVAPPAYEVEVIRGDKREASKFQ